MGAAGAQGVLRTVTGAVWGVLPGVCQGECQEGGLPGECPGWVVRAVPRVGRPWIASGGREGFGWSRGLRVVAGWCQPRGARAAHRHAAGSRSPCSRTGHRTGADRDMRNPCAGGRAHPAGRGRVTPRRFTSCDARSAMERSGPMASRRRVPVVSPYMCPPIRVRAPSSVAGVSSRCPRASRGCDGPAGAARANHGTAPPGWAEEGGTVPWTTRHLWTTRPPVRVNRRLQ